ncbi:seizure protein 6 homolog isoform X2 [Anguilla anguilla]|uniref:seizure protein 6 homolog isoform X2 n=1 Tax=Anguilla anguilla TaxID=7936 RepID=UPI0015AA985B|nr:seizure protein 6 homolog isoform X2 [Anguilla anguilla]
MLPLMLTATLCVTFLHLSTGLPSASDELGDHGDGVPVTSDPPQQQPSQSQTSVPQSLRELLHAALLSKEYLGHTPLPAALSLLTGATDSPTRAAPSVRADDPPPAAMSPGVLTTAETSSATAPQAARASAGSAVTSLPAEEETTTTLITTTTITTVQAPVQCNASLYGMEGVVESPDPPPSSSSLLPPLECTYSITVYPGYGVEIQVKRMNLSKGEILAIRELEGTASELLANETLMSEGQVIRSSTNRVQIHYRSLWPTGPGVFSLRYRAFLLSCTFPPSPAGGSVTVTGLHPGGRAHFHCDPGFQVRGHEAATCLNSTRPRWSSSGPQCVASCGGWIRNATVGWILSPPQPPAGNHSGGGGGVGGGGNLSCTWVLEARRGRRLHLHFQRLSMDEDYGRLMVRSGNSSASLLVFDSDLDDVPDRGVLSMGSSLYVDLTADSAAIPLVLALRYEAFDGDHCYEPYLAHGNYSSSDLTSSLGTVVSFSCSPGFVMEQGSGVIECVDPSDPHWNESEPVCRALCGGELTEPSGTVLSPDWPLSYSKGQDCVWLVHVGEDKRIELDVQILNIRQNDMLTIFDGHDLMSRVIGQYLGSRERFQVVSGESEVMIQFQSDPDDGSFFQTKGFRIQYREVERNDTCPAVPPIEFGWKSSSHPSLVRGSVLTYQCQPGYDMVGPDIIACQWDLSWSSSPPTCQKSPEPRQCPDPGDVPNGVRSVRPEPGFATGTVVRFSCNLGYELEGPAHISCLGGEAGEPKWSEKSPKCVLKYEPCPNPGVPHNGYQTLNKRSYRPGESLHFFCFEGYELIGEVSINCLPGHPSQWNSPPPFCRAVAYEELLDGPKQEFFRSTVPSHQIKKKNSAFAIVLPVILLICLIGGVYMYYAIACRQPGRPRFRKPLSHRHAYSPISVKTDFSNSVYEAADTREYEVSI